MGSNLHIVCIYVIIVGAIIILSLVVGPYSTRLLYIVIAVLLVYVSNSYQMVQTNEYSKSTLIPSL